MKTMKKILTAICSSVFALALSLGFGFTFKKNVEAKAATANEISVVYGALQFKNGSSYDFSEPEKYAFVLSGNDNTPKSHDGFTVLLDGKEVPAYTISGHNIIYVSYEYFQMEIGDVALLTIPAGTYYQPDAYTANEYNLFIRNKGQIDASDKQYAVYINGSFAENSQYPDYPHYKVYDQLDITRFCREGENHMAIIVWYYGRVV